MVFPNWAGSQLLIVFRLGTECTQSVSSPWAAGGYWDLCLVLWGLQASQFLGGKQGHENEREMRGAEVHAVPLARSVWVGLPGDSA